MEDHGAVVGVDASLTRHGAHRQVACRAHAQGLAGALQIGRQGGDLVGAATQIHAAGGGLHEQAAHTHVLRLREVAAEHFQTHGTRCLHAIGGSHQGLAVQSGGARGRPDHQGAGVAELQALAGAGDVGGQRAHLVGFIQDGAVAGPHEGRVGRDEPRGGLNDGAL